MFRISWLIYCSLFSVQAAVAAPSGGAWLRGAVAAALPVVVSAAAAAAQRANEACDNYERLFGVPPPHKFLKRTRLITDYVVVREGDVNMDDGAWQGHA